MYSATARDVWRLRAREREALEFAATSPSPIRSGLANIASAHREAAEKRLIAERDPLQRAELAKRDGNELAEHAAYMRKLRRKMNPLGNLIKRFGVKAIAPLRLVVKTAADVLALKEMRDQERVKSNRARLERAQELEARKAQNATERAARQLTAEARADHSPPQVLDVASLIHAPRPGPSCGVTVAA